MVNVAIENTSDWQALYLSLDSHTIVFEFSGAYHCRDRMDEELLTMNRLKLGVRKLRKHLI